MEAVLSKKRTPSSLILRVEVHRLDVGGVACPVGVVQEFLEAVGRHEDFEVCGYLGLVGMEFVIVFGSKPSRTFIQRCRAEDVVARDDVLRTQGLPVVTAVLDEVEHAQLLEVLATGERAVLNNHLQVRRHRRCSGFWCSPRRWCADGARWRR